MVYVVCMLIQLNWKVSKILLKLPYYHYNLDQCLHLPYQSEVISDGHSSAFLAVLMEKLAKLDDGIERTMSGVTPVLARE